MNNPANRSLILLTGTSSGIGRAGAFALAKQGYDVLATIRKQEDAISLRSEAIKRCVSDRIYPFLSDITIPDQRMALIEEVNARCEKGAKLHALINNAGALIAGPVETMPEEQWRSQFELLFFAPVFLTQALMPQLRTAKGRVINVTSIGGIIQTPTMGAYQSAKSALESVTDVLRMECARFGVQAIAIEPGAIVTPLLQNSKNQFANAENHIDSTLQFYYADIVEAMKKTSAKAHRLGSSPDKVASVMVKAVTSRRPATRYLVGPDAKFLAFMRRNFPDRWYDFVSSRLMGIPRKLTSQSTHQPDAHIAQ